MGSRYVTPDGLLNAAQLAEYLGLSRATVLDWFEAGRLPGFRLGGRRGGPVRFRLSEVEAMLESWRTPSEGEGNASNNVPVENTSLRVKKRSRSRSHGGTESGVLVLGDADTFEG